jgi:hypothetical protein
MNYRKMTVTILGMIFIVYLILIVSVDLFYYYKLSRFPAHGSDRTVQIAVSHGSIRYASNREAAFKDSILRLWPLLFVLFFTAAFLGIRWQLFTFPPIKK